MTQKNSFITMLEKVAQLNKNSVEILTKMTDVVSSDKNSITINYQENDGKTSTYEMPTIGYLQSQIDIANSNIKKLSALEGDNSVIILDQNNNSRKVKSVNLEREPTQISDIPNTTVFQKNNNWFFDSLINPLLSVQIDLSDKISDNINKILSRRYIIKFKKDSQGILTVDGNNSKTSFENSFLNKNDFSMYDFSTWLNNTSNIGVVDKEDENLFVDEQYFDINYKLINNKGYFSVLKLQKDNLNNKVWYHLNTLTYYDRSGGSKTLGIGDILAITSNNSYSKYKIIEVNTSESLFRISVERIEGYDPIPIGNSVLEYYSTLETQNTVKISIGFDEYNVIFIKSINTENNIICSEWSKGMAFYTNDLVLDTDNNVNMTDYYLNSVYDYGMVLKDMVAKKIPSQYAITPNKPTLVSDNFKVVQINKHLTDTKDLKTIKNLHAQKNTVKSKLSETQDAIIQKNKELNTKIYKSVAEKSRSQNELNKLIQKQDSDTKLFSSYVNQITNSRLEETAEPKFRIRGFWDIPSAIIKAGYKNQEVIGFEVQYMYGSKNGANNTTDGFELKSVISSTATELNTTIQKKTAYFSSWIPYLTDIRKRTYNETTGSWIWNIEDVSDADTPNINQLDISIQKNEKVNIKIRSISEVGYPETPVYSDWSDILTIEFPDELSEVLGENQYILKEATQEEMRVKFETELSAKGILKHVSDSFYVNEKYVAHTDKTITTSFKDSFGNSLLLFDYLKLMNDKITALEETIKRAKGELKITLFNGTQETVIANNGIINISIDCEDYMIKYSGSTGQYVNKSFINNIYLIHDYYIQIDNIATENDLGLFSDRSRADQNTTISNIPVYTPTSPTVISSDGYLYEQCDYQYVNFYNSAIIDGERKMLYGGDTTSGSTTLKTEFLNIGAGYFSSNRYLLLQDNGIWVGGTAGDFGATVHPYVNTITNFNPQSNTSIQTNTLVDDNNQGLHILESQKSEKIPIHIYFKPDLGSANGSVWSCNTSSNPSVIKKALRIHIEEENGNRPFEFTIIYKLNRHKQYAIQSDYIQNNNTNSTN